MAAVKQYSAGHDFISATKMNYFHYFLKQLTGWTLHPCIKVSGTQPCQIGDMGTQTAIWAIDAAEDPNLNATVVGFDKSDKFYPPAAWAPRNLTLRIHDILNTFPNDILETLDVVHFRLFLSLDEETLGRMIENAITLLKPGGYVQWVEHDKTNLKPVTAFPGQNTSAVKALIELEQNPFPDYNAAWVNTIAPIMDKKGLAVLAEDRIQTRLSLLTQMNELHLLSLVDLPVGLSKAADKFKEQHFESLANDSAKGISSIDSFIVVVAQKPLN